MSQQKSIKIKNFEWYYKESFNWQPIKYKENQQRCVYNGIHKNKGNDNEVAKKRVIIKSIIINEEKIKNKLLSNSAEAVNDTLENEFEKILKYALKEVYFLASIKKNRYFAEIVDVFISDNFEKLFIILKDDGVNLKDFIEFNNGEYFYKYPDIPRKFIFTILCGLKFLHENDLSHNDLSLENILVDSFGNIKICGLSSTDKVGKLKGGKTNGYLSPSALLDFKRTKEDDIWAAGVIFLELSLKKCGIFIFNERETNNKLKKILIKFYNIRIGQNNWNEGINYDIIIEYIKNEQYNAFEAELKQDIFIEINKNNINDIKRVKESEKLIRAMLEINPNKRPKLEAVNDNILNSSLFDDLEFSSQDSIIDYKEDDYNKYFNNGEKINKSKFIEYLEDIKEKFIGHTIFE